MNYCKVHNEPINIITDKYGRQCKDCYKMAKQMDEDKKLELLYDSKNVKEYKEIMDR